MKILNVEQIRRLDAYTIDHEPIAPIDLMERASAAFVGWFVEHFPDDRSVKVFCGMGNNGGDGLAIARMLLKKGYSVEIWVVRHLRRQKDDFTINFKRLQLLTHVYFIEQVHQIPVIGPQEVVVDAMLGSGITRPMEGITQQVAQCINDSGAMVVSVDVASGLFADRPNAPSDYIVRPTFTVSFELPKLAFMQPRLAPYVGEWCVVPIGLSSGFIEQCNTPYYYTFSFEARQLVRSRGKFAHKGTQGHALLIAGSYGSVGAAVLAARACLRSGVGLLTVHVPRCGYAIVQTAVPEAMCTTATDEQYVDTLFEAEALRRYSAIGIGPGLGLEEHDRPLLMLEHLLDLPQLPPLVLDADALNNLSAAPGRKLLKKLPPDTILTPHPKEFERLLGHTWDNDYEKLDLLRAFCLTHRVIVVLKGAHTAVALPTGEVHFNSSGNPGMATGGSGDVLTGVITALLAQGYPPAQAAILGVYQHGLAGDRAAERVGMSALIASDLVEHLRW